MSDLPKHLAELSPEQRELLALLLSKKKREDAARAQIAPRHRDTDSLPLSSAQQRLWFLSHLQPVGATYHIAGGVRMRGPLQPALLEQALNEIVRRHEALRTTFGQRDDEPVQLVAEARTLPLTRIDLRSWPARSREAEAQRLSAEEARAPFDLSTGPLLRVKLLLLSEDEHILLLTMHHIISDGWSIGIFIREMAALYEAYASGRPSPFPQPPLQYADYALWQRERMQAGALDGQLSYWKQTLAGAPALLELPTDRPRPPAQSFSGAKQALVIPRSLTEALRAVSERANATLYMTLLAAFKVLLYRYTGQPDIVVGASVTGRDRPELESSIGFFVNTLPLRAGLDGNPTFGELLGRVRAATLGAYDHQEVPFEKLVEVLQPNRDLSHAPLFQVMFNLQNLGMSRLEMPGIALTQTEVDTGTSKFDLTLNLTETAEGLTGWLDYNTDLFDASTVERMAGHLLGILEEVAAEPGRRLDELSLLTPRERHQLLVEWNASREVYPHAPCLHQIFEEQVERTPDHAAVVFEGEALTFRELNRQANRLAHHLRGLGVGPEVLVGVCMERSPDLIVALMAVLKAGGAYVPLDPDYPLERLAFILEDTAAPVILTQRALAEGRSSLAARVVCVDAQREAFAHLSDDNPASGVTDENLAYVIYTSGSTGKPKGAMLHHRGVRNRLLWGITDYCLGATDAVLHKTPLSFDVSVWEIFAPLLSGARLVVARPGGHQDSAYLIKLMADERVTHVDFVPSMLQVFLDEEGLETCSSLKLVTCAGEALTTELRDRFYARTGAKMYNLYGPTEASLAVTYWVCSRDGRERVIPIGRPMSNVSIYLLDKHLRPVPVGVAGELYIGGLAPGRGYLNRADLTADKFIPDPFGEAGGLRLYRTGDLARYQPDGAIQFLGRIDHQVKIRGMRMELGEVEAVLDRHPEVKESVVLAREVIAGDKSLVAYVVGEEGATTTTKGELRNYLRERLPEYMVPSAFVMLGELPLTPNGKLDRGALPLPDDLRSQFEAAYVEPETDIERTIAAVWRKVFQAEKVGIHSNFFDLGGNSLLMARVHGRLRAALNREIPMVELFRHPTIHSLAQHLGETAGEANRPASGLAEAETRKRLMSRRKQFNGRRGEKV
ncbi:MAG TPA: amino acid adenylation domain-containing protein [Pyrinomonadaceae bacterium]|nr:amino acid adenylation domain-containing protein [Pyrinomonadaceae bacterium]